jgi:hypothetical protein
LTAERACHQAACRIDLDINLQKRGLSGLLGIGRVEFSSAATDDADVIFWNTPEAEKVRDLVRSLQT